MPPESVTGPSVLDRVEVGAADPRPEECLPPGEAPLSTTDLSPGWVAVTERELLLYHPDRDPPVDRVLRANVTGLALRRAGGRQFLGHAPAALLYALGGAVVGALLLMLEPTQFVTMPENAPLESFSTIVRTMGWGMNVLGAALVFTAILAGLGALAVAAHWLVSREVTFVVERGDADPLECPTTRTAGQRTVRSVGEALRGDPPAGEQPGGPDLLDA